MASIEAVASPSGGGFSRSSAVSSLRSRAVRPGPLLRVLASLVQLLVELGRRLPQLQQVLAEHLLPGVAFSRFAAVFFPVVEPGVFEVEVDGPPGRFFVAEPLGKTLERDLAVADAAEEALLAVLSGLRVERIVAGHLQPAAGLVVGPHLPVKGLFDFRLAEILALVHHPFLIPLARLAQDVRFRGDDVGQEPRVALVRLASGGFFDRTRNGDLDTQLTEVDGQPGDGVVRRDAHQVPIAGGIAGG